MKTIILALAALFLASGARAKWAGKLDLTSTPSVGAWQSMTSSDQALGISKSLWILQKDGREVAHLGVFGGVKKPLLTESGTSPTALGGAIVYVPGSDLDWALGTNWGDQWVPALKTSVLFGYDISRPKTLHAQPDFIGAGITYKVGTN